MSAQVKHINGIIGDTFYEEAKSLIAFLKDASSR
jgi:hypothetical protein